MLTLRGSRALSKFRQTRLLKTLQGIDESITNVQAQYIHFVDTKATLSNEQAGQLNQLLSYGETSADLSAGELFLIVPRIGTISPWSSKATDIVHNAGLTDIDRVERGIAYFVSSKTPISHKLISALLHDRMTETVLSQFDEASALFNEVKPRSVIEIDIISGGKEALITANSELGLAIAEDEIEYLYDAYNELQRNPTDMELMMFAQVNSEHCRHKIFNADWTIDGHAAGKSLFKMIKNTYEHYSKDVLSAYSDNAAVLRGNTSERFFADPADNVYRAHNEPVHLVIKVETHNHPTAIAPAQGAATGAGGEIRDEGATGRGAKPKMGLAGYTVSNLMIPKATQPWESTGGKPSRITSALDIMIEAPVGAASFANEFGRPNLTGYFRTYEQSLPPLDPHTVWGYHKPIMIAGGLGNIRDEHVLKETLPAGTQIIVLGGPSMLIGLGGGAASSMQTGSSKEDLDFASVQRGNGEIERRVQEVIDRCWAMGDSNPIISIHDVGAGGVSNALPELVHDSGVGAVFELRKIPSADPGLSPMEIWCNEAQERYVLGIANKELKAFEKICERERCPYSVVGETTTEEQLVVTDSLLGGSPVDLPLSVLFGKPPKMARTIKRKASKLPVFDDSQIDLDDAVKRVLHLPAVGSKKFLITIGDRTIGGMVVRDQMVGKWQIPVSDVAVTSSSFSGTTGEAMSMGERTPLALIDSAASARIAVGEAITNIAAASIKNLSDIKLSANWMAAAGYESEDERLYDAVKAVGEDFCPPIGLTIPVGKDSLSMRTVWQDGDIAKSVTSPLSVIITAFSPVDHIKRTLTPDLKSGDSELILIDLGLGENRLGGSALAQVYNQIGNQTPDIAPELLKSFFDTIQSLNKDGKLLAYHDRSDGGLFTTVSEMIFAGRRGAELDLTKLPGSTLDKLFNEELGAVIQVGADDIEEVQARLTETIGKCVYRLGKVTDVQELVIEDSGSEVYRNSRSVLETWWASTSYEIQSLRDNAKSAKQEFDAIMDDQDPGLIAEATFAVTKKSYQTKPKIAIFREQGVNGQVEMAAAFDKAGFTSVDVHIQDLLDGKVHLKDFVGLVACGGFSYGDVLGAGEGWAKTILFHDKLRKQFSAFFMRKDTFSLGVCNGCQMLSSLKELIPGTELWPRFLKNASEQFEARLVNVRINESPSIFFKDMAGSILPVPVAHGEGRAVFANDDAMQQALQDELVPWQFVDGQETVSESYPRNPNGSPLGITALTTPDGRSTIVMPHPERVFLTQQLSWHPEDFGENSPWFKMFQNAREWIEDNSLQV
ncbi:MAG: phosphoribosylformylglycinamidine synthase [Candidatus Saccharibacteria bacterium]|nr:phosphoribosylformylglycinamidine synthase [Candidatus Saccharibacteria bacterium]